jgi:hypothetical protein
MPKADEWKRKWEEWKAIQRQPKNLGMRDTGISNALDSVRAGEVGFAKIHEPKQAVGEIASELQEALSHLITTCTNVSNQHKRLFTTACQAVDHYKEAAIARRAEATREEAEFRTALGAEIEKHIQKLKAAKDMHEFSSDWRLFALDFQNRSKAFRSMAEWEKKVLDEPEPTGTLSVVKDRYVKLAQNCKNSATVR